MSCRRCVCADCGDALIHQSRRGAHESSSELGQYVHDQFPTTFFAGDLDLLILKRSTSVLRVIEHKRPGAQLSRGQLAWLPLLAQGIAGLDWPATREVAVVWSEVPPRNAEVQWVSPAGFSERTPIDAPTCERLLTGEPVARAKGELEDVAA